MTGEVNPQKDYDAQFGALTAELDIQESDPVTTRLLNELQAFRDWLKAESSAKLVNAQDVSDSIEQLNIELGEMQLYHEYVTVTGKVRPYYDPEALDDEILAMYTAMAKQYELGEMFYDERGPYFVLYNAGMRCHEFSTYVPETNELADTRLELMVVFDPDSDQDEMPWCIDSEDIVSIIPTYPSVERIERDLAKKFPKIFRELEKLPTRDDEITEDQRLHALEDFVLDIDWAEYEFQYTKDELDTLPWLIDDYITARLGYDGGEYSFFVKGIIMSAVNTADGIRPLYREIYTPMEVFGSIGPIRLMEIGGDPDLGPTTKRYKLKFTTACRIKGGGAQYVEIPVDSLIGITSMSNDLLFTDGLVGQEDDTAELFISPEVVVGEEELVEDDLEQPGEVELVDEEGTIHMDADSYLARVLEGGATVQETLELVLSKLDVFRHKAYVNYDEAVRDVYAARDYTDEVLAPYLGGPCVFEVSGEDLRYIPFKADVLHTDKGLTLNIDHGDITSGDEMGITTRRGRLEGCEFSIVTNEVDDEQYSIVAELRFKDVQNGQSHPVATNTNADKVFYTVATELQFRAHISENTQISIPRCDELTLFMDTLDKLEKQYPEYEELVPRLLELQAIVDAQSYAPGWGEIGVEVINELFELASDNTLLRRSITRALAHILDHKAVVVRADYVSSDGEIEHNQYISGAVVGISSPDNSSLVDTEALRIGRLDGNNIHVPINSIREISL